MTVDVLAPCVTRSSAAMVITMQDQQVFIMGMDFNFLCHLSGKKLQKMPLYILVFYIQQHKGWC